MEKIKVVELFAGVGGFRIGLGNASKKYEVVWSNQWEPATETQDASDVYVKRFGGENHSNVDIAKVDIKDIPKHNLLVGGFPCQDYSVAKSLSRSKGITGKKGVLWWEIHRILKDSKSKPEFEILPHTISPPAQHLDLFQHHPDDQDVRQELLVLHYQEDILEFQGCL